MSPMTLLRVNLARPRESTAVPQRFEVVPPHQVKATLQRFGLVMSYTSKPKLLATELLVPNTSVLPWHSLRTPPNRHFRRAKARRPWCLRAQGTKTTNL